MARTRQLKILKLIPRLFLGFTLCTGLLAGCSSSGDDDSGTSGSSNWDEMVWDRDKWGA